MINDELHQKIDEIIGKKLEELKIIDPFLYYNLEKIDETISNASIPNLKNTAQGALPYVPIETSLSIAADFLEKCNPTYKKLLLQKYRDGLLIFCEKRDNRIYYNFHLNRSKIFIKPEETLIDAIYIIHEIIHDTNMNDIVFRYAFTETVSIASELMFLKQLEDNDYSKVNINLLSQPRGIDYQKCLKHLRWMLPLFISKKNNGRIDESIYDLLPEKSQISSKNMDQNLNIFLKTNRTELRRYRYAIGYMLAKSFVSRNPTLEELSKLSETLKEENIKEENIKKFYEMTFGNYTFATLPNIVTEDEFSYQDAPYVKKLKKKP